jgi:hypothetical protein
LSVVSSKGRLSVGCDLFSSVYVVVDALGSVYSILFFLIIVFAFRALVDCYNST